MAEEDDIDIEELKRQTSHSDRLNADADNDVRLELKETSLDELAQIDAGEKQKLVMDSMTTPAQGTLFLHIIGASNQFWINLVQEHVNENGSTAEGGRQIDRPAQETRCG